MRELRPRPATAARWASVAVIDAVRCSGEVRCSGFPARSLARRRSGVRFIQFSFRDLLEITGASPGRPPVAPARPARAGSRRPPREHPPRQQPAAGLTPGRGATDQFLATPDALLSVLTSVKRILAPMHPGYCPQCGERVTPYAAGCALCGADLDPKRWQKPIPVRQRLSVRMPAGLRRAIRGRSPARVRGSL